MSSVSANIQMRLFPLPEESEGFTRSARRANPRVAVRLRVCNLGSGSGGNATAVAMGQALLLIDAGFGPRTTARRLRQAGTSLDAVQAVCLTHFDTDHFRKTWISTLLERRITVHCHRWHVPDLLRVPGGKSLVDGGLVEPFTDLPFEPVEGLTVSAVRLQHDRQGTIGYRLDAREGAAGSVGYATDLGHVPDALIDLLAGVGVLCLECNYDEQMTIHSSRPSFVNRRNLSDSGHLSNEQAFDAVRAIDAASPSGSPRHVVLMHRSSQCNHETKVRRVFERDERLARRVVMTQQRRRTRWLTAPVQSAAQRGQLQWSF